MPGTRAGGWRGRACCAPGRTRRRLREVAGAYAATVEVEGPQGVELVDARSSDALNLAVLTAAPILVALEMLEDSDLLPACLCWIKLFGLSCSLSDPEG
jgi:hypothetical protein